MKCYCVKKSKIISEENFRQCIFCIFCKDTFDSEQICKTLAIVGERNHINFKSNMIKLIRSKKLERILK